MIPYTIRTIERAGDKSLVQGQQKYRDYFISTTDYEEYRAAVETALRIDGYGDCIVTV